MTIPIFALLLAEVAGVCSGIRCTDLSWINEPPRPPSPANDEVLVWTPDYDYRERQLTTNVVLFGAFAGVFMSATALWTSSRLDQMARNAAAQSVMKRLRNGKGVQQAVLLYLRSFNLDDRFGHPAIERGMQKTPLRELFPMRAASDQASRGSRLENYLHRALIRKASPRPIGVSLGRGANANGFGRITTTDARWQEDARLLIARADRLLLLYAKTLGTSWELGLITAPEILRKTVFLFPPTATLRSQSDLERYEIERGYHTFADILEKAGYAPPPFQSDMAFAIDPDAKAVRIVALGCERSRPEELAALVRAVST